MTPPRLLPAPWSLPALGHSRPLITPAPGSFPPVSHSRGGGNPLRPAMDARQPTGMTSSALPFLRKKVKYTSARMIPIPINDHIRRQTFWFATLLLIVANFVVFFYELSLGPSLNQLVFLLGVIPARYTTPSIAFRAGPVGLIIPIFTSMFLHAGWLHILGNMLFLFVFGRSVEDRFGHGRFLIMYFASGLVAALAQVVMNPASRLPTIGASGAIAGILGAYLISFPAARITTLIPLIIFFFTVQIPAVLILGYWFLVQFVAGFQMLTIETASGGGVAWWAHIGGFILGMLLALVMPKRRKRAIEVYPV
jgi:rhomboid family protein